MESALEASEALFNFVTRSRWRVPDFQERAEVLRSCALAGWRSARQAKAPGVAAAWFARMKELASLDELDALLPNGIPPGNVSVPPCEEAELCQPETLLTICGLLRKQIDSSPQAVLDRASFVYEFLEGRTTPVGRFDEREYLLGELALIAGIACRLLSLRREARAWSDRAEAAFGSTVNAVVEVLRVNYLRLALRLEERQWDLVLELAPSVGKCLSKLGMREDALKCRFLEVTARGESGDLSGAVDVAEQVCLKAQELGDQRLVALAYSNLGHFAALMGDASRVQAALEKAIPVLRRLNERIALIKAEWTMGNLYRKQAQHQPAIEAFNACRQEFQSLGMSADVAAMHLAIADLLLETGQDDEAILEVLSALSIIEEVGMTPERVAALSLLRESLRQQKINRQALRDLNVSFERNLSQ